MLHNIKPVKHIFTVPVDVKKAPHHAHVQSLAESARAGEQRNFIICAADEIIDQFCLVRIDIINYYDIMSF